jgi:hypothetical protein
LECSLSGFRPHCPRIGRTPDSRCRFERSVLRMDAVDRWRTVCSNKSPAQRLLAKLGLEPAHLIAFSLLSTL